MVAITLSRNCVYQLAYHVVWCPKFRKSVLTGGVGAAVGLMLDKIRQDNKRTLLAKEIPPNAGIYRLQS